MDIQPLLKDTDLSDEELGLNLFHQVRFRGRNTPEGFLLEVVSNISQKHPSETFKFKTIEEVAQSLPDLINNLLK